MRVNNFFKEIKTYLLSIYFWRTIIGLIAFIIIVVVSAKLYLKFYTRHGENFLTPAFIGLPLDKAQKLAEHKNIKLIVIDSIYEGVGKPGTVVDQTPPPNFAIKKGRSVFITIKAFSPKIIEITDSMTYVSLIQAQYDLQRLGLKIGNIYYTPSRNFPDLVLAVLYKGDTLRPGMKIKYGEKVDLVVGKLPERTDTIPLENYSEDNAEEF